SEVATRKSRDDGRSSQEASGIARSTIHVLYDDSMMTAAAIIRRKLRRKIARNERLIGIEVVQAVELNLGTASRRENGEIAFRAFGQKAPMGRPREDTVSLFVG